MQDTYNWEEEFAKKFMVDNGDGSFTFAQYPQVDKYMDFIRQTIASTRERTIAEVREKVEKLDRDKPGEFGGGYNFATQEVLSLLNDKGHE